MNKNIQQIIQNINLRIDQLSYGESPAELYDPIAYIMALGGKRMRPLLSVLAYQLYKSADDQTIDASLAVEIFHNFTLMHDDIMDEAPLRRGQVTVHEKWNAPVAILSGDVMLVRAYEQILNFCPPEKLPVVLRKFNRCAAEVCEGQQHDMNFEKRDIVSEEEYISMISQKTAVLLGFSLEFGAILADADKEDVEKLYQMGVNIGIGFQLMDDLLDVYADQSKFGKQVGGDIISNKKTYLLIKAKELAKGEDKELLDQWLSKTEFDKSEKVEAVKCIYQNLKIKELSEAKMDEYFQKGFANLESIKGNEKQKQLLSDFFHYLIKREH
ncbi:polyprenyl synthetase family protein [Marivirga sp. S37H4]|uniref:Polyprenyl synthetase family protein n=1 Tax=Marivirga aurantiaca TaxID=2802615 RepID=A0A934WUX7_9BACT|nr:polyprenyl synthetase family protein [Marivirga aurantiaca]MBK6263489.1 polyprenyl synthetase family protein [Marivirga aurantiaca]